MDSEQIEVLAKFQIRAYFGDGSNLDLLRAAGIEHAKALVIGIDEHETTLRIAEKIRHEFPKLPIFARAYDRIHAYKLLHIGVHHVVIETTGSAIHLGQEVLTHLGVPPSHVFRKSQIFKKKNDQSIVALAKHYHELDQNNFIQASREMSQQLENLLKSDRNLTRITTSRGAWEGAPRAQ
jgi:voltage-gated potassium channel Kch